MSSISEPLTETSAWNLLRYMADALVTQFGKPGAVARSWSMSRPSAGVLAQWLRAMEAWLRRLLLLAASRIAVDPPRVQLKARPPRKVSAAGISVASDNSAEWRVSFALAAGRRKKSPRRGRRGQALPGGREHSHFGLAMRFEALLRAIAKPEPLARRLARAVARDAATPNRIFHTKIRNMGPLEAYVRDATLLVLSVYPDAWVTPDSS